MKATELMIGDWVEWKPQRGGFIGIVGGDRDFIPQFERVKAWHLNSILNDYYPIPLTPEILEKNGWEKAIGDNPVEVWTIKKGVYLHNIDNDYKLREGAEFNVPNIQYVHTLQHALCLCGLNEIADNFKV